MLKPGMFISDRYEIIDKVGSGGMADVYKARCHRLNRFVAMKVLKQEYSDDKKFVAKFRGEAQSAAGLSHPNIVNVYDVGEDDGLYYIVMELVEGITLKNFIDRKDHLEVKEAIGISIQIAQGLEAAHANHIIHRDIKPQNIIISREGKVKVTDFGIAKAATSNTITSNAMGSVHYISPEQARGGYSDERSDIYSLGVTMYEMLTGKVPFAGDNTVSVALQHIQGEPVPLRELDPSIQPSLERIVQKCMQKKPERRYLSATELITDLKHAITNPSGDFVKIAPMVINDSPTINISDDEVSHIKSASKVSSPAYGTREEQLPPEDEDDRADGDDEEGEIDPKLEKIIVGGSIAAGVILVALIVFIVFRIFMGGKGDPAEATPTPSPIEETLPPSATDTPLPEDTQAPEIQVPALTGLTLEQAFAALGEDFKPAYTEKQSDVEAGKVIEQDPEALTMAATGSIVNFVVSSGPQTYSLIDVYGQTQTEAQTALSNAGLVPAFGDDYSSDVEAGRIIRTEPGRGSTVKKGDVVKLIVSKGTKVEYVNMPELSGLTEKDALKTLKNSGLVGKADYKNSDTDKGKVFYQSYSVNEQVEKGTTINFTVSLGPKVVQPANKFVSGDISIEENPFTVENEIGYIKIVLEQDGKTKTIYDAATTYEEFPLPLGQIVGFSDSTGQLRMYVGDEDYGIVAEVSFSKESQ